jgi:hypothetical protein
MYLSTNPWETDAQHGLTGTVVRHLMGSTESHARNLKLEGEGSSKPLLTARHWVSRDRSLNMQAKQDPPKRQYEFAKLHEFLPWH